jgi:hypothetical protein
LIAIFHDISAAFTDLAFQTFLMAFHSLLLALILRCRPCRLAFQSLPLSSTTFLLALKTLPFRLRWSSSRPYCWPNEPCFSDLLIFLPVVTHGFTDLDNQTLLLTFQAFPLAFQILPFRFRHWRFRFRHWRFRLRRWSYRPHPFRLCWCPPVRATGLTALDFQTLLVDWHVFLLAIQTLLLAFQI